MGSDLDCLRVLFRAPDTLTLYGIPYDMRPGQSPGDLWRAHHEWVPPRPGWYGSKQVSLSDWVYLGQPGWYGSLPKERIREILAFLDAQESVPENPYEWCQIRPH